MRVRAYTTLTLLLLARIAAAQQVRGAVRDAMSHLPIAGAVVMALDAAGKPLARDLTNAAGEYALALSNGAVRVRVVRIGFHPRDSLVTSLAPDVTALDFTLEPLPSLLERVTVNEAEQCPQRDDRGQALGLWEQARAGLLASVAARDARPGDMRMLSYQRLYTTDRAQLLWQQVQDLAARTARPFVPVQPAAEFAAHGYLTRGMLGAQLAAPDADVLLDDSFAATHCFSIARADALHPGQIGLAFEPAPGRSRLVDVRGVLWIDRVHPAIRMLDFRYTGLSRAAMSAGSGGTVSFRAAPNGVVFIDDWTIVSADVASYREGPIHYVDRPLLKISGGRVSTARWSDGTHWESPTGSISGHVHPVAGVDSSGVSVWLAGTTDTTATDSTGRFRFAGLLTGPYQVFAASAPLAGAGVPQNLIPDSAVAAVGDSMDVVVHLDSAVTAARGVCGDPAGPMPGTVLFIRVADTDDWVVRHDSVTVTWQKPPTKIFGFSIPHEGRFEGRTGDDGRVTVCDPPRGESLAVSIGPPQFPQLRTTVTLPIQNPIALVTLRLPAPGSR